LNIAELSTVASAVVLVALVTVVAFVGLGLYRARHSAADAAQYRALAEQATAAEIKVADGTQATAAELKGVRSDLQAARDELVQVTRRLAALETLLSQIG
jgi:hypothetical protein